MYYYFRARCYRMTRRSRRASTVKFLMDEWPNKVYVARSKWRPPFEENEIDVDSLPSEWSIGTG